jgi:hypothetical protein
MFGMVLRFQGLIQFGPVPEIEDDGLLSSAGHYTYSEPSPDRLRNESLSHAIQLSIYLLRG